MKKKTSQRHKKQSASKRGPFISDHPLNGVPLEIRQHMATEHGRRQLERFETLLPQVTELVGRIDPLHTLALMSTYGLMRGPNQQGNHKRLSWKSKIQQGHIEFLQALCLRNRLELTKEFPEPSSIQLLFDWLPDLFGAYHQMGLGSSINAEIENVSKNKAGIIPIQEFMRANTSVVRNWGYFGNVTRISRELLSRVDDDYERLAGMKLSKIIDIFEGLVRRHEQKINQHLEKLHSVFSLRSKETMLEKFFATFEFSGAVEDFRAQLADPQITYEQAKCALLPYSDRFIGPALIITNQEIAEEFGLDIKAVAILTNRTSLAFSDVADEDPKNFLLDNPVWLRPLIYVHKDSYFCALPQTLLSFVFPIADELLVPFDGLQTKLSNARAIFLEDEVERLFEIALPSCIKHRGFKWKEGSQQFESDLIIRFDTTVILIEAKSGRISWPALRGAPSRLIEHIKKLIVEPSDQSGRLAQRLEEDIARLKNNETPMLGFPLSMDGVTCVVRLSVMLQDFATIQSVPAMLADASVLKNTYPLAPCISLADLEVMLDLLDTPYLRLHYMRRRAELLMSLHTFGDELDMLGMYLDTGLNLGTMQAKDKSIIISGYSAKIDRYYSLRDESLPSKKPKPNTSQWFKSLCEQLEKRARPGWSEIACALLSIAPVDQIKVEGYVRSFAKRVKAKKPLKFDQDTMMLIPPEWSDQALAFQVKSKYDLGPYSSHSQNIALQAFESKHVKRCFVLVIDASDNALSYLSATMFTEGDASHTVFY